jgi:hypothetical protein
MINRLEQFGIICLLTLGGLTGAIGFINGEGKESLSSYIHIKSI